MSRSLSLILPVHNAQATLARDLEQILEFLPDVLRDFEILVIDEGSRDQTREIAADFAAVYPQIRVATAGSSASALHHGIQLARGEMVMAHDGHSPMRADQIVRLWQAEQDRPGQMGGISPSAEVYTRTTPTATISLPAQSALRGGFQILDPRFTNRLRESVARVSSLKWLDAPARITRQDSVAEEKGPAGQSSPAPAKKPNYLTMLRERLEQLSWSE
ncbi:MAG: glycosyltransferase family 2 protein [Pirellulales bacterium]|nr:glycosyltransferase family 2 protein [Pirellulales bacterium]